MTSRKYETGEVVDLGKAIYQEKIKHLVEPAENGKFVVIDVESGDYEIDEQVIPALDRLRERQPHAVTCAGKVGFPTAYKLGGGFRFANDWRESKLKLGSLDRRRIAGQRGVVSGD